VLLSIKLKKVQSRECGSTEKLNVNLVMAEAGTMNQAVNFVRARGPRLDKPNTDLFKWAVEPVRELARYLQRCVGYVGVKDSHSSPQKLCLKSTKYRRNKNFLMSLFA
jgi:hypothetical protein